MVGEVQDCLRCSGCARVVPRSPTTPVSSSKLGRISTFSRMKKPCCAASHELMPSHVADQREVGSRRLRMLSVADHRETMMCSVAALHKHNVRAWENCGPTQYPPSGVNVRSSGGMAACTGGDQCLRMSTRSALKRTMVLAASDAWQGASFTFVQVPVCTINSSHI